MLFCVVMLNLQLATRLFSQHVNKEEFNWIIIIISSSSSSTNDTTTRTVNRITAMDSRVQGRCEYEFV
jgi:hypothetical protein